MRNLLRIFYNITTFVFLLGLLNTNSFAQSVDDCLMCHEDNSLTKVRNGKTVSLYVNKNIFQASVHKGLTCAQCHRDAAVKEFPHPEKLSPVNCGNCHAGKQEQVNNDMHHKLLNLPADKAPTCKICHGMHDVQHPAAMTNKDKAICGKCHKENKLASPYHVSGMVNTNCLLCHKKKDYNAELAQSVHSKLQCSNCHSYVVNNFADHRKLPKGAALMDCYLCHADIAAEHKESIHGISLAEGIDEAAQCWNCHGSHSVYPVKDKKSKVYPTNLMATCGACHDDPEFAKKHYSTVKQPGKMYSTSVHGKLVEQGRLDVATCVTCHGKHNIKNRVQEGSQIASANIPNTCAKCHKQIVEDYQQSIHWIGVKKGVREAPSCNDCHSEHSMHAINTVDKREEIKRIQAKTCLECHQNLQLSERYGMAGANASKYEDSYHGLAVKRGDKKAAMCVDCHGVHKILPKKYAESSISKQNIVSTCKKCHPEANVVFANSYSHITEENTSARKIEDIVGNMYFWLIVLVVGFMFLHNLIIFVHDLRTRYSKIKKEIRIPRFTTNELIQHIILLVSFIILAMTGFQLKYPDSWWSEGLTYIGLTEETRRIVHRSAAVVMMLLSLYHFFYLIVTARGRATIKSLLPRLYDVGSAINNVMYYLHLKKKHPEFDYYDYTEKIEYWALIWGTVVMGFTGLVLWFPTNVGDWAPVWFIKVCETVHFYEAVLATLAIVIWHWFFVMFRPQEYPMSFTCLDGKMTITHYKDEHKLKFKKILVEYLEMRHGIRSPKKLSNLARTFISSVEKHGVNFDDFVHMEFEKDEQLKNYFIEKKLWD